MDGRPVSMGLESLDDLAVNWAPLEKLMGLKSGVMGPANVVELVCLHVNSLAKKVKDLHAKLTQAQAALVNRGTAYQNPTSGIVPLSQSGGMDPRAIVLSGKAIAGRVDTPLVADAKRRAEAAAARPGQAVALSESVAGIRANALVLDAENRSMKAEAERQRRSVRRSGPYRST